MLVLGLLSLVICQLLGPVALIMGNKALKEVDQSPVPVTNRGSIQAGRICGLIATLLMILVVVLIFAVAVLGESTSERFEPVGESITGLVLVGRG